MSILTETNGNKRIINIGDRFDFSAQEAFHTAYKDTDPMSEFVLDFSATDYMDSSALGMLLLRDYAGGDNARVELTKCQAEVKNILEISNFQKLFKIN